eukprot:UN02367
MQMIQVPHYEVVLPTGEIVDYKTYKNTLSSTEERRKVDPLKYDHKNQMVDMEGRTYGRGGHKTARASVMISENPTGEDR